MAGNEWNTIAGAVALAGPHHMQKCGPHRCFNMGANSDTPAVGNLGVGNRCFNFGGGAMARHANGIAKERISAGSSTVSLSSPGVNGGPFSSWALLRHRTMYRRNFITPRCMSPRHQPCCCRSMASFMFSPGRRDTPGLESVDSHTYVSSYDDIVSIIS